MINHILLEIVCEKENDVVFDQKNIFDCKNTPRYECLLGKCPFVSFTTHENAFCYIDSFSEAKKIISFGGEMIPNCLNNNEAESLWEKICIKKIDEAYDEYMNKLKQGID